MERLFIKNKSVLYTWSIFFVFLVIIPILVGSFIYFNMTHILDAKIAELNNQVLLSERNNSDNIIREAQRLSMEMGYNQKIQDVGREKNFDVARFLSSDIVVELQRAKLTNYAIEDIYVLFPDKDIAANTSTTMIRIQDFLDIYYPYPNSLTKEMLSKRYQREMRVVDSPAGNGDKLLAIFQSVSVDANQTEAVAIVFFDLNRPGNSGRTGQIYLQSPDRQFTYNIDTKQTANLPDYLKNQIIEKDGEKQFVSSLASDVCDWMGILIVPVKEYRRSLTSIRSVAVACMVAYCLVAFICVYFFVKRQYSSISRIARKVSSFDPRISLVGNEYDYIYQVLDKSLHRMHDTDSVIHRRKIIFRQNLFQQLLSGRQSYSLELDDLFSDLDIQLPYANFAVVAFYIENPDGLFGDDVEKVENEEDLIEFIFSNIFEELLMQANMIGHVVQMKDILCCIVNFEKLQNPAGNLRAINQKASAFILQHFNLTYQASLGKSVENIRDICYSYTQAVDAMQYGITVGEKELIVYEEIENRNTSGYYYPLENELELIGALKRGQIQHAVDIINRLIDENISERQLKGQMLRYFIAELAGTIIKLSAELEIPLEENVSDMELLFDSHYSPEIKEAFRSLVERFSEQYYESRKTSEFAQKDEIRRYVEENYTNPELSVAVIAEQFHLHPTYLSKMFKESTGEGMLDYLYGLRISRAKELLKENRNMKIEEVSQRVGFAHTRAFTRAFVKFEGITPSRYRQNV